MRAITAATAARTLGLSRKRFDNLLARLGGELVPRGRQGVERHIPVHTLEVLALCGLLTDSLGVPARDAYELSRKLLRHDNLDHDVLGSVALHEFVQLGVDRRAFLTDLHERLAVAIETSVRPRRGRPRVNRRPLPAELGDA